ncbi:DUF1853 family protein [Tenacibaculum sp. 190524A05c]|uniref:DUF1853 family protein n=1 Tax=Tenacibaculum platacis TaxID=3137852 RepID=UPI0032B18C13
MYFNKKELQQQYQGFCDTNLLWTGSLNKVLQNIDFQYNYTNLLKVLINTKLRLGKLVEQFVFNQFSNDPSIEILTENLQIQNDKITIGELDCILLKDQKPIHLEIVYKFYLYDKSVGTTEIEHWIGPNRRDSFDQKYNKLVTKQLPLLNHSRTKEILQELKISTENISQQVYFKAQLFPHISDIEKQFPVVNNDCISGYYIYEDELEQFKDCKFYIPTKHNWLIHAHPNVDWMNVESYKLELKEYFEQKNAPLCWVKKPNGVISKLFVVWW